MDFNVLSTIQGHLKTVEKEQVEEVTENTNTNKSEEEEDKEEEEAKTGKKFKLYESKRCN